MQAVFLLILGLTVFLIAVMMVRIFKGPTVFDRMNGLGIIGADVVLLLVLFGYIDNRPDMYVDIAISYAILGFITSVILAKYIGGKWNDN